jgi:subtilase family serine protease
MTACVAALVAATLTCAAAVEANAQQVLTGHVPHAVAESRAVTRLAGTSRLNLAIGLPLRNQNALDELLAQLSDPASPNFGHYLSAEQFAAQFGPTEEDYQTVIHFARENGLVVTATHPNRVLLDVSGDVSTIEKVFHVRMMTYDHAVRGRFYAPDREPSLDLETQVLDISGLDNFVLPQPMNLKTMSLSEARAYVTGSGPGGYFIGKDFRAAYAPGVSLTGSGQVVGLLEFDGFYAGDVQKNAAQAGLPQVPTQTVLLDGFSGTPGSANIEVILDIMMASYMAPGLSKVMVYEGYTPNDILNRMATDNLAKQLSSSWGYGPINATTEQIFKQYIAQGQSLLQASGDSGAYTNGVMAPSDDPNLTVVGGTSLTTAGSGGPWQSEKVWSGSGGGVSTVYPIPSYQQGLSMAANGGSTKMRNIPDVALTADIQMFLIQSNGQAVVVGGTSAAAPLWSGFIALANQQAAGNKKSPVGFLNPLLYSIGSGKSYTTDLNDIRSGSNGEYSAASGYDLTTGWGSPAGQHLINDLTNSSGAASFSLSASASALSLPRSSSAGSTVSVAGQNGFSGSVSLIASGLPSGVTAAFSPSSTTGNSSLTFTASSTAATGTFNVTVTGVSGALSSTTSISLTVVAPNFALSLSGASLSLPRGSTATGVVTVTPQNGFNSAVSLSASGLPSGVTVAFGAVTAGTSLVTFTAGSTALAGSFPIIVNGVSGALKSSTSFTLTVLLSPSGTSLVNLAPAYNINAMVVDGLPFAGGGLDGGLNGSSTAYSANLLGVQQTIRGMLFFFGPANAADAVSGKTVSLPPGQFSNINLLATGVNGSQFAQVFKVTYSDGTSSTFTQNLSDWFTPQNFAGETKAMTMPYRDNGQGQKDNRTFNLYEYTFALTANKTVVSITLPNDRNVVVLAASLTNATASNRHQLRVK